MARGAAPRKAKQSRIPVLSYEVRILWTWHTREEQRHGTSNQSIPLICPLPK
ncbi:hypothetical protein KSC_071920 [Ktedonobacter sp. SOSP1-52]|nr:hypothetical protein KSC_071920 [Ktedonobacter sp. SOSP1-52]